jgi:hypothetical protein
MNSDLLLVPDQGQCYAQAKEAVVQTPNSGSWDHVSRLLPIRVRTDGKAATCGCNFHARHYAEKGKLEIECWYVT